MLKATINTGNIQQNETKQNNEKKKKHGEQEGGCRHSCPVWPDNSKVNAMADDKQTRLGKW